MVGPTAVFQQACGEELKYGLLSRCKDGESRDLFELSPAIKPAVAAASSMSAGSTADASRYRMFGQLLGMAIRHRISRFQLSSSLPSGILLWVCLCRLKRIQQVDKMLPKQLLELEKLNEPTEDILALFSRLFSWPRALKNLLYRRRLHRCNGHNGSDDGVLRADFSQRIVADSLALLSASVLSGLLPSSTHFAGLGQVVPIERLHCGPRQNSAPCMWSS